MKKSGKHLLLITVCLLAMLFSFSAEAKAVDAANEQIFRENNLCVLNEDGVTFSHFQSAEPNEASLSEWSAAPEGKPQFIRYVKGDSTVNMVLNFVNYPNVAPSFTSEEIRKTVESFSACNTYFQQVSQNKLSVKVDYVVTCAPQSYNYYAQTKNPNYTIEQNVFNSGISLMTDENGNPKEFAFENYQIRINIFGGNASSWNTFLWPHSYSSDCLIMLTQNRKEIGTVCHEMLHAFGIPDLYTYTGSSQTYAVGALDIMGNTTLNNNLNNYYKYKAGWISMSDYSDDVVTQIEALSYADLSSSKELTIYPSFTTDPTKTLAFKFGDHSGASEFFVVEYRIKNYLGKFDTILPYAKDILIYRVNKTCNGNSNGYEKNGRGELIFMGNTSYDISTSNYINSCPLTEGKSYGGDERGNTSFVYSSAGGSTNLFNGDFLPFKLTVKTLTDDYAVISIENLEPETVFTVRSNITGDGSLSIGKSISLQKRSDCEIDFFTEEDITYLAIDGEEVSLDDLIICNDTRSYVIPYLTSDHEISVGFGELRFPLTYELNGGSFVGAYEDSYRYGRDFIPPIPTREGYQFLGWSTLNDEIDYIIDKLVPGDYGELTFYAIWSICSYTVTTTVHEEGQEDQHLTASVEYGDDYQFTITPKTPYTIASLKIDGEEVPAEVLIGTIQDGYYTFTAVKSDHTFEITIGVLTFPIRYETDGGILADGAPASYEYGKKTDLPAIEKLGCRFLGWSEDQDGEKIVTAISEEEYGEKIFYAKWERIPYTIIFRNDDGTEYHSVICYYGEEVKVPADPQKAADETFTYKFSGWDKQVTDCRGNATYTALYDSLYIDYTVKFLDFDGIELSVIKYHYGDDVKAPKDPERPEDETFTYKFSGWDKQVTDCRGNATYTALYDSLYIDYTVKFLDFDGTELSVIKYHYGDDVKAPEDPARAADQTYTYSFMGWDSEVTPCRGNATYTATYSKKESESHKSKILLAMLEQKIENITEVDLGSYSFIAEILEESDALINSDREELEEKLEPILTAYTELVHSINEEYETAKEIEGKYFISAWLLIESLCLAAFIAWKGNRWF